MVLRHDMISTVLGQGTCPLLGSYMSSIFPSAQAVTISYYQEAGSAMEREALKQHLQELKDLGPNWDGYGANIMSEESLTNAFVIASAAVGNNASVATPTVSPNPNGTVSLEWEDANNEAYLEVGRTRTAGYLKSKGAQPVYVQGTAAQMACVLPAMLLMLGQQRLSIAPTLSTVVYHNPKDV